MIKRLLVIPARSGSKRIKNKNIRLFQKKPVIYFPDYFCNSSLDLIRERDVDIIIAWGYKKSGSIGSENKNKAEKSMRDLQEWTSIKKTKGILETFYFPKS